MQRPALGGFDEQYRPVSAFGDSGKLEQLPVEDFTVFECETLPDDLMSAFSGHTMIFSALGIYTKEARDEAHFKQVEVVWNMAAFRAALAGGASESSRVLSVYLSVCVCYQVHLLTTAHYTRL